MLLAVEAQDLNYQTAREVLEISIERKVTRPGFQDQHSSSNHIIQSKPQRHGSFVSTSWGICWRACNKTPVLFAIWISQDTGEHGHCRWLSKSLLLNPGFQMSKDRKCCVPLVVVMKITWDHLYKALKGKVCFSHSVESNSLWPYGL